MNKYARFAKTLFLCAIIFAPYLSAVEITDMAGRKVNVPQNAQRVYSTAPPMTLLQYIIAPKTIVAMTVPINSQFYSSKGGYLDKFLDSVPSVGGWHGNAKGANMETLLALKPQLIIAWRDNFVMKEVENSFKPYNIPVFFIAEDLVTDEPNAIRFAGKALFKEARAEELAKDAEARLDYVKNIASNKKSIVYYAEGPDGLATECEGSFHYEPIKFVGVKPAFECVQKNMIGMEKVNIEQVIAVNPDIIIAQEESFYKSVKTDSKWKNINAVKNSKIYLVPKDPINFLDRPPSFMRILGVEWLASVIHPDLFKKDIKQEVRSFYKLYLRRDLSDAQVDAILSGQK